MPILSWFRSTMQGSTSKRNAKAARQRRRSTRRLFCEPLEQRELMAGVSFESALGFAAENGTIRAGDVVHDSSGNAYLSGSLHVASPGLVATVDLDPSNSAPDDPAIITETQLATGFIAKYDSAGVFQWVRTLQGQNGARIYADLTELEVGASGDIYFAGIYFGNAVMDNSVLASADDDRFVGRLAADGIVKWLVGIESTGTRPLSAKGLAVDESSDRRYVTGSEILPNFQIEQGIVVSLNASGSFNWSKTVTSTHASGWAGVFPNDLAVDSAGAVHVVGHFNGIADFDPSSKTFSISSGKAGRFEIPPEAGFVWNLTASGALGWAKAFTGAKGSNSSAQSIAIAGGNLLVSGNFTGTIDFDPGSALYNVTSTGNGFLLKLSSAGAFRYVTAYGGSAMALDAAGDIYVVSATSVAKLHDTQTGFVLVSNQSLAGNMLPTSISVSPAGKLHVLGRYFGALNADDDADAELDSGDDSYDLFWLSYGQ